MNQAPSASERPDIYTPARQLLMLLHLGNYSLLSRPDDPVPRALRELLDFDRAALDRLKAIEDNDSFYAFLQAELKTFCNHLLLGELVYGSPLGPVLAGIVVPEEPADGAVAERRRAEVCAYVQEHAGRQRRVMEEFLLRRYEEDEQAEAQAARSRLWEEASEVFARLGHTLGSVGLPAPTPAVPVVGGGWSVAPGQEQLDLLALATVMLRTLPLLSRHPYAQAVMELTDYHPQRLEELTQHLNAAPPGKRLTLTRAQGLLLYQAAQVTLVSFLHDILDEGGLDDLLQARLENSPEAVTPEMLSTLRASAAMGLGAYLDHVGESEAGEAGFELRRAELAQLLELAAG